MKIQDLKIVFISPNHNAKYAWRTQHMLQLLRRIGCRDVTHCVSGHANYPNCLREATITILKSYPSEPILILEDDVDFTGVSEVDWVEGVDAVYVGLSRSAGHPTENTHLPTPAVLEPHSATQARVLNMLATHAVLYVSDRYKRAVVEALGATPGFHQDVVMARLQPSFLVLANKVPSFYQANRFNEPHDLEEITRVRLS
jgi:hypothetical protein